MRQNDKNKPKYDYYSNENCPLPTPGVDNTAPAKTQPRISKPTVRAKTPPPASVTTYPTAGSSTLTSYGVSNTAIGVSNPFGSPARVKPSFGSPSYRFGETSALGNNANPPSVADFADEFRERSAID